MPWELTGNAGTNPTNDFLGTTDEQPLVIRTNDSEKVRVMPDGNVAIGPSTPTFGAKLTVAGGGATVNGVAVGTDVPGIDYDFQYETVGVADPNMHLRLQSPNLIIFHTGDTPTPKMTITEAGNVGIGTPDPPGPQTRLHISSDEAQLRLESTTNRAVVQMHKSGQPLTSGWDFGVGTAFPPNPPNNDFWFGDFTAYRLVLQKGTGNVGIGTNNPGAKLDISGSGGANQCCAPVPPTLSLAEASSTQNRQAWLQFHNAGEAEAYIRLAGGGPARSGREGQRRLEIGSNQPAPAGLTVQGDVGIGIGTETPSHRFHVRAQDAVGRFESTGTQAFLQLTTTTTPTVPGGMENRVEITNRGRGRLTLWTVGGGDIFNITRAGNVGIGTLTVRLPPVSPVPGELILGGIRTSISGFDGVPDEPPSLLRPGVRAQAGVPRGTHCIRTNGNEDELWIVFYRFRDRAGYLNRQLRTPCDWVGPKFWESSSDARVKTNVRQVEGALDRLERIRGVTFESAEVDSPHALGGVPGTPSIGVVAQEVEEVFPELVSIYDPEQEYRAVDYNGFTGVLIEAVKELKAQNEELRSRIEALERA